MVNQEDHYSLRIFVVDIQSSCSSGLQPQQSQLHTGDLDITSGKQTVAYADDFSILAVHTSAQTC